MELNREALAEAYRAYEICNGTRFCAVEAAIKAYIEEAFRPNKIVVGELSSTPVVEHDHRKELWVDVYTSVLARSGCVSAKEHADHAVEVFDLKFGGGK